MLLSDLSIMALSGQSSWWALDAVGSNSVGTKLVTTWKDSVDKADLGAKVAIHLLLRVIMNTQAALGGCRTPGDVMVKVLSMSIVQ